MSPKSTVVLLVVLVALCAGYWLMVRSEEQGRVAQEEAKRLFALTPDDVVAVEVAQVGMPVSAGRRGPDGLWAFTKPHGEIEANQVVWERMAIALAELDNQRTIEASATDLAQYGLDDPVLRFLAETKAGDVIELIFGSVEPTQTYRYASLVRGPGSMVKAGAVLLVSAEQFHELDRARNLLRSPYLFALGPEGITRVEFARIWTPEQAESAKERGSDTPGLKVGEESVVVAIEKDAEGVWQMVSPFKAAANQELIGEFVKEIQYATGRNYIDEPEDLSDYGLDPPRARVTVLSGSSEKQTAYLGMLESTGDASAGLFVKRAKLPAVFVVDTQMLMLLPNTPDAFRERRLFTQQATNLQTIHYVSGETDVMLENDPGAGWRIVRPAGEETDQIAVSNFIALLKALEGRSFPGGPGAGFTKPRVAIEFTFRDERPPTRILVGAKLPDVDEYYARQDNETVTTLNELDVRALTKDAFTFRNKKLMALTPAEASRVSVVAEGTEYVFERPRGKWVVTAPAEKTLASSSDVALLVDALASLNALEVVEETAPADLSAYGLDAPVATVRVTVKAAEDEEARVVGPLVLGSPSPANAQRRYASSARRAGVYLVEQAIVDDIRETLKAVN
ncbi:MAG: DUF4340 domain-containing protein [Nitrospiraceae bacterium]|nr:DUF4340 domain-containing protein [Nitrospiraceae bacterium]